MKDRLDNDELRIIRANTDWRELFAALGIQKDEKRSRETDWWGFSPFNPEEQTASFHFNDKGWYCHSTHQGGGPIELVERLEGCNCHEAGRWLLEHGVSHLQEETRKKARRAAGTRVKKAPPAAKPPDDRSEGKENTPVRQDLRPLLSAEHPVFRERGIAAEVLAELGIGYFQGSERSRSPLRDRLVFQIRGVVRGDDGELQPVILSHIGRATTEEQVEKGGKWHFYAGFRASRELYNLDQVLLEERSRNQARETGRVVIVEGCFDVAKLCSAGIRNVVATFGSHLAEDQRPRFELIASELGVRRFLVFFDRDQDGSEPSREGAARAVEALRRSGFDAESFDWEAQFLDRRRGMVGIDGSITDPCEMAVDQLSWLREKGML